jgi:hypothetical protein
MGCYRIGEHALLHIDDDQGGRHGADSRMIE